MKIIIPLVTLLIGFGIGLAIHSIQEPPTGLEGYPVETLQTIEAITNVIGPLSEEDVQDIIELTAAYNEGGMREINLRYVWEGNAANAILDALEESKTEEAKDLGYLFLDRFREQYEKGLELGEWGKFADGLYERSAAKYDEPDSDGNAEKPPGVERTQ